MHARTQRTWIDGTAIFKSSSDERAEQSVAEVLENAWRCKLVSFGQLAPLDWYAVRDGRMVGLIELKCRTHASGQYPTVYLNLRKWISLMLGSVGMGVPALFVVQFEDEIRHIAASVIDASEIRIGGWASPQARADTEPVIEVPVAEMKLLGEA